MELETTITFKLSNTSSVWRHGLRMWGKFHLYKFIMYSCNVVPARGIPSVIESNPNVQTVVVVH